MSSTDRPLTGILVYRDARARLDELATEKTAELGRAVSLAEIIDELLETLCLTWRC